MTDTDRIYHPWGKHPVLASLPSSFLSTPIHFLSQLSLQRKNDAALLLLCWVDGEAEKTKKKVNVALLQPKTEGCAILPLGFKIICSFFFPFYLKKFFF